MDEVRAFAPGRTEIAGNHTDHQGGRVIAAALNCGVDIRLVANGTTNARLESDGFEAVELDVRDLAPREDEFMTTAALVRGVVAGVAAAGVEPRGFDAQTTSTVPPGGGLSSSAAFELALAAALFALDGGPDAPLPDPVALALIGQAAERDFFGKPCGLMDQLAVALGGVASIDFADSEAPAIERIDFDFEQAGLSLCLIDTHCDHSTYTREYAQVAKDMSAVARYLGAARLSQIDLDAYLSRFADVRREFGDVPSMRALHYYHENRLVDERAAALRAGDVAAFLDATRRSGASSAQYLQNVSTYDRISQPAMVALALADAVLAGEGACRIHGGGFGGTVQAFVPAGREGDFKSEIDRQLGKGSSRFYRVSKQGAHAQW